MKPWALAYPDYSRRGNKGVVVTFGVGLARLSEIADLAFQNSDWRALTRAAKEIIRVEGER